ncbi:MAG: single-stranded DNA-binding protein [bacterium]
MKKSEPQRTATPPDDEPAGKHRNFVEIVGELAGPPDVRELPSGDLVTSLRLTVRTLGPRRTGTAAAPATRADSIDCAVWRGDLRARVCSWRQGDVVALSGALRHRYWRGPQGLGSRYEVEVSGIKLLRRAKAAG